MGLLRDCGRRGRVTGVNGFRVKNLLGEVEGLLEIMVGIDFNFWRLNFVERLGSVGGDVR
jgi:hypothetical protein